MTVASLLDKRLEAIGLPIELLGGGDGLARPIASPHVQKMGLALAGFDTYLQPGRILVFGESEVRYLESLDSAARRRALEATLGHDLPCLLLTGGPRPPGELLPVAEARALPVLLTPVTTPMAIAKITALLDDRLAVREMIHGVLVDTLGLGVLLVGDSGIGKSECALDLVVRGHRLVADDTVEVRRRGETTLVGSCPVLTRHHMEVRGLGLINVRDLFGVASTRTAKRIELVVQLERWDPARAYERLGIDEATFELLGLRVPLVQVPVAPGRSLASLVEVAARNQILRSRGRNAARLLADRVDRAIQHGDGPTADDTDVWIDIGGPE
jgi:HPr kinase/phosphorylase